MLELVPVSSVSCWNSRLPRFEKGVSRSRAEQRYGIEVKRRAAAVCTPDTPYILTALQNTTYDENQIQRYQGEITRKVEDVGRVHLNSWTCLLYLLPQSCFRRRVSRGTRV